MAVSVKKEPLAPGAGVDIRR